MIVRVHEDLIRDERLWLEAGDYDLVRVTDRGYLIVANRAVERLLAQIPFSEGELIDE